MNIFSKRNQFDPRIAKSPIMEDAPKILRLEYWNILQSIIHIDQDARYSRKDNAILGIKKLLENLCLLLHEEPGDNMYDSWYCTDELKNLVMDAPWYHFYDIVEGVYQEIIKIEDVFYPISYQNDVNEIFENNLVIWRLNNKGILERAKLEDLEDKSEEIENILEKGFPVALQNLRKAKHFVTNRPLDPENAIKEAVSAVEGYGRILYKDSSTLGDVIKNIRKKPFPPLILNMMEKFYAFASSEPGVRHGGKVSSGISLVDADFCIYVSIAFIDYLHKFHNK